MIPIRSSHSWKLLAFVPLLFGAGACAPAAPAAEYSGLILPNPLEKPAFTFTDVEGRPFDFQQETKGFVTLLFFGYSNCPDVCPIHMANIGAVLRDLPAETASRIKVVFVTTDPDRDTPERMSQWLGAIHPAFIGLRGPLDEVHAVEASLLLPGSIIERPAASAADSTPPHTAASHAEASDSAPAAPVSADYTVGHASAVVAFTADGLARVMYSSDTRQQDWRRDLPRLVAAGGS